MSKTAHSHSEVSTSANIQPGEATPTPASLPQSDVSSGVGLAGLIGLIVWILFCRTYPLTAEWLSIPGPREVLSGPNAALMAMVFTAGPMALWSVLVDRVHLRPTVLCCGRGCINSMFIVDVTYLIFCLRYDVIVFPPIRN